MSMPRIYGLFHRHIAGDEALLELARRRFDEVRLGAEFYPANIDQARQEWRWAPTATERHFAHLPRHWDLLVPQHREQVLGFSRALAERAAGLVVHDQRTWWERAGEVRDALRHFDAQLRDTSPGPLLYFEYASDLPLEWFVEMAEWARPLERIRVCLDIGHVLMFAVRSRFAAFRPEIELSSLADDPERARSCRGDLERAMRSGMGDLMTTVASIAELGRPVHFHLHDAHPLSRLSYYGVSDHLSFFEKVPVATPIDPKGWTATILGPAGLDQVVERVLVKLGPEQTTFTLEIHPTRAGRRAPVARFGDLFTDWKDLTHAELMNGWLDSLSENAELLQGIGRARGRAPFTRCGCS